MEQIIILGTGCAGLTAAVYAARAGLNPLVLEGNLPGGQLTTTSEVENYPGFPEGVDGFELTDRMRRQAERFGARYEHDRIARAELAGPVKRLHGESGTVYETRALVIATGASPRLLGVPGEKEYYGGKGVTTCATCDGAFYRGVEVAVVGGGDTACEEALFLTRFASKVHLIHRRDTLRASKIMAERVLAHEKIVPHWNRATRAVEGGADGKVCQLRLADTASGAEELLPVRGVFIAIGHQPNSGPFAPELAVDENGYFVPEAGSLVRTRVPGVFVAGDCADHHYRQAITAAGMGCMAAIDAERWLAEQG